ncbi:hypothetical protein BJ166DRAFT_533096 [Pestalotiopsis sp. NC0098]|nr:hypothetical protein BJ166DRAFT_533096 [Pestalotiopsis sp. NC0098]
MLCTACVLYLAPCSARRMDRIGQRRWLESTMIDLPPCWPHARVSTYMNTSGNRQSDMEYRRGILFAGESCIGRKTINCGGGARHARL